jgi:hypothetical protein
MPKDNFISKQVGTTILTLKRIEHAGSQKIRSKSSESDLEKKTTVHHLLEVADSYMLTVTIAKPLLHSRQEMSSGRFTKKEESQPKAKRQPEGNVSRDSCHSSRTADEK